MRKSWIVLLSVAVLGLGCSQMHMGKEKEEEGDEKNEVKMNFSEVPPAVQAGLTREAGGAAIRTVDREEQDGKTIYETDVMMDGKNWEIKVDSNGNVISKKEDDESKEKQGKKDKEEDEEKEEKEHK